MSAGRHRLGYDQVHEGVMKEEIYRVLYESRGMNGNSPLFTSIIMTHELAEKLWHEVCPGEKYVSGDPMFFMGVPIFREWDRHGYAKIARLVLKDGGFPLCVDPPWGSVHAKSSF